MPVSDFMQCLHTAAIKDITGFDYNLDAINPRGTPNELSDAFRKLFKKPPTMSVYRIIKDFIPMLDIFVSTGRTRMDHCLMLMPV